MDDMLTHPDSWLWAVFHAGVGLASVSILATLVLVVRWLETASGEGRMRKVTAAVLEKLVVLLALCALASCLMAIIWLRAGTPKFGLFMFSLATVLFGGLLWCMFRGVLTTKDNGAGTERDRTKRTPRDQ